MNIINGCSYTSHARGLTLSNLLQFLSSYSIDSSIVSPIMHRSLFNFFLLYTAVFLGVYPLLHGQNQCQWTAAHFWFIEIPVFFFFALLAVAVTLYALRCAQDQSAKVAGDSQEQNRDQPLRLPCQETQLQTGSSKMVPGR